MDEEGWYSAVPEDVADYIMSKYLRDTDKVGVDLMGGVGGSAIKIAQKTDKAYTVELNSDRCVMIKHNAEVYDVSDKLTVVRGDLLNMSELPDKDISFVFSSPPWGGMGYDKTNNGYDPTNMELFVDKIIDLCECQQQQRLMRIILHLPKTTDVNILDFIIRQHGNAGDVKYEQIMVNKKPHALIAIIDTKC